MKKILAAVFAGLVLAGLAVAPAQAAVPRRTCKVTASRTIAQLPRYAVRYQTVTCVPSGHMPYSYTRIAAY